MTFRIAAILSVLILGPVAQQITSAQVINLGLELAYRAVLSPVGGSGVTGHVVVYSATESFVAYSGTAAGLQANRSFARGCNATALACRPYVYNGTSCANLTSGSVTSAGGNPWANQTYKTDSVGFGVFGGLVKTDKYMVLQGRPFVLHAANGSVVACGMLQLILSSFSAVQYLYANVEPFPNNSTASGRVVVVAGLDTTKDSAATNGQVCVFGFAQGLETGLLSARFAGGEDCNATNGCGVHIHAGTNCSTTDAQGPHYYNTTISKDPWLVVAYPLTTGSGGTYFAQCVDTGLNHATNITTNGTAIVNSNAIATPFSVNIINNYNDYLGKPLIIHSNAGKRVACGILREQYNNYIPPPVTNSTVGNRSSSGGNATSSGNSVFGSVKPLLTAVVCVFAATGSSWF